ncbi:MAG: RluA family pseudouridine synthase [Firmicutes bacterium]|nr:RluA family pseudouridine synthase [Bacillota bacterium]
MNRIDIVFEDEYLLVINKPAGILSQCDGEDDIVSYAGAHTGGDVFIVNRLDRPVGGLVLLAKDKKTAAALTAANMEKYYLAVVCGVPADSARLENYLFHDKRLNVVKNVNKGMGKLAVLEYEKLWQREDTALLKIHLLTGRHHQIRAQMLFNGTPIYGDTKYNPAFKHKRGIMPALFSHILCFAHPVTKEELRFEVYPNDEIFN